MSNVNVEEKEKLEKLNYTLDYLNIGCGNEKWKGFINVDCDESLEPDIVCDVRHQKIPIEDGQIKELWMCHTIEHIEKKWWASVFFEINRVLEVNGTLVLTYPEFTKCVDKWEDNTKGMREYWEACLYGRQASPSDYHVSICHSPHMTEMLKGFGFDNFVVTEELESQYTVLKATKVKKAYTKEDMLNDAIFKGEN